MLTHRVESRFPRLSAALDPFDTEIQDEQLAAFVVKELSGRELSVFCLAGRGHHIKQVCDMLKICYKTTVTHRRRIMEKLNLTGDAQLGVVYWRTHKHIENELRKS